MNERQGQSNGQHLGDWVALAIQQLHQDRRLGGCDTLIRIDNLAEAADAPFQFDPVNGALHRKGCRVIPRGSRSALYSLWRIGPEEQKWSCPQCRPMPDEQRTDEEGDRIHLLFGLISVVDQFAGVLKERGRDFQKTSEGQKLATQLGGFYRSLGQREKEVLDTIISSLDQLTQRIREIDTGLNGANGPDKKDD